MSSNRPIKFRVWDAKAKTYLENEVMWSMAAKMPEEVMGSACPWVPFMMIALHSPADKYVVEQFTGLLDKNHKEIYEGDIIQCECWTHKGDQWDRSSYCWQPMKKNHWVRYNERDAAFELAIDNRETVHLHGLRNIVMIGNIRENPELITTQL